MKDDRKTKAVQFAKTVEEILDNLENVKGEKHATYLRMECNMLSLLNLWRVGASNHEAYEPMSLAFVKLLGVISECGAHLAEFNDKDVEEMYVLLNTVSDKYEEVMRK